MKEIVDLSLSAAYTEADLWYVASVCLSPSCADFCHQASGSRGQSGRVWRKLISLTQFPTLAELGAFPFKSMRMK